MVCLIDKIIPGWMGLFYTHDLSPTAVKLPSGTQTGSQTGDVQTQTQYTKPQLYS